MPYRILLTTADFLDLSNNDVDLLMLPRIPSPSFSDPSWDFCYAIAEPVK